MAKRNPKDLYLKKRSDSAIWWYRRNYPKALRAELGATKEVSLQTSDIVEARKRRDRINPVYDAEVAAVEGRDLEQARAEGEWYRGVVADNPSDLHRIPTLLDDLSVQYGMAEEAGDEAAMAKAEQLANAFLGVKGWREAGGEAIQKNGLASNTAESYARVYEKADRTGLTPAARLTRDEAGAWLRSHAAGKSKSWRNQHRSALKLVTYELLGEDKAEAIWDGHKIRISKKKRNIRPITLEERALVLEQAGGRDWMEPASLAAMALGLRQEELREHLTIKGTRGYIPESKTTNGKRNFVIIPEVMELLKGRDEWPTARSIGTLWGNAKRAAGLGEDVNWHALRHATIEIAMELEIPYEVRGRLFGHEKGRGSEKTYTHVSQDRADKAAKKLQREVLKRVAKFNG